MGNSQSQSAPSRRREGSSSNGNGSNGNGRPNIEPIIQAVADAKMDGGEGSARDDRDLVPEETIELMDSIAELETETILTDEAEFEAGTPNAVTDLISATTAIHHQQEAVHQTVADSAHPDSNAGRLSGIPKELRNLLSGGLAGMIAKSVVAPMDRIKILYQVSNENFRIRDVPTVIRNIVAEEGLSALWKGNLVTMIRVFPYSGIQFMVFDRCKTFILHEHTLRYEQELQQRSAQSQPPTASALPQLPQPISNLSKYRTHPHKHGLSPIESLLAGMAAGMTSVIFTYPLDLTRAQLAVLRKKKHIDASTKNVGFVQILASNYNQRGVYGLFRGISPTLLGILPYSGTAFALNEQAKRKIQRMTKRELTTIERMQCGALSGLFAQSLTYPLEVTRRRMQTIGVVPTKGDDAAVGVLSAKQRQQMAGTSTTAVQQAQPPSMVTLMKELYQEQGVRGFFKGVTMNWFKGPVAFSISFTAFDVLQRFFETPEERNMRLSTLVLPPPGRH